MKSLNYSQLNPEQKQQISNLIAQMEGQQQNSNCAVRFVARGATGGEFGGGGGNPGGGPIFN
ncbi:hypothetical protein D5R40_34090 [Okeania hirsuta]|uniref:Uncharacterized protein n=1 Tax=Okeania hirsuta TaxID=1458930 RepID=A0A3N6P0A1_9CYAN|nr:hypothetical protein [Okeania hirsuta]RQH15507.1 hypothetical protein D5R40_34090 [Okeania hirsuta]